MNRQPAAEILFVRFNIEHLFGIACKTAVNETYLIRHRCQSTVDMGRVSCRIARHVAAMYDLRCADGEANNQLFLKCREKYRIPFGCSGAEAPYPGRPENAYKKKEEHGKSACEGRCPIIRADFVCRCSALGGGRGLNKQ